MHDDLMTSREVADLFSVSIKALYDWRRDGTGPAFMRTPGGHYRYRTADVMAWILAHTDYRKETA